MPAVLLWWRRSTSISPLLAASLANILPGSASSPRSTRTCTGRERSGGTACSRRRPPDTTLDRLVSAVPGHVPGDIGRQMKLSERPFAQFRTLPSATVTCGPEFAGSRDIGGADPGRSTGRPGARA